MRESATTRCSATSLQEWNIGPGTAENDSLVLAQQGYLRESLGHVFYQEPKKPEWLPEQG